MNKLTNIENRIAQEYFGQTIKFTIYYRHRFLFITFLPIYLIKLLIKFCIVNQIGKNIVIKFWPKNTLIYL
jgi:hypothetical protein